MAHATTDRDAQNGPTERRSSSPLEGEQIDGSPGAENQRALA
jgi:hypothetical protein